MEKKSLGNRVGWFDIPVIDLDRAIKFYATVLKIEIQKEEMPGHSMGVMSHGEGDVSGCLYKAKELENGPSARGILLYFTVEGRLDEALNHVELLGGKIKMNRHQIGPYGFRAIILDSEGNQLALHSSC